MAERLEIIISATNQASGVFRTLEREALNAFGGIGTGLQNMGNQIAGIGQTMTIATAPLAAGLGFGVKTFSDFETVLAEIAARTGATAEQMEAVKVQALDMGAKTSFSATQAAEAMLQLLASGYDLNQTFQALPATLNAAAAGGLDLGYTADVVTDALAMWNLSAEDATRVADTLAAGAAASSAEINDLAQGLSNVGPIASEFGLSIEDTVAILAAFSERGIKGAEAGTQLRSMLNNMTRDTEKVTGQWEQLGISMFDTQGRVRPLTDVMEELRDSMADMSDEERIKVIKTLAGTYGQMGLSVLTSSDAMEDMASLMSEQADAATVATARMNTLAGRTESLKGSIETLMINALEPLIENTLKPLIVTITETINKVNEWALANPEITEKITEFMVALVATGPVLMGVGKAITFVGWTLSKLISPFGLASIAVGALYVAYQKNIAGIGTLLDKLVIGPVARIGAAFAQLVSDISEFGLSSQEVLQSFQLMFGQDLGRQVWALADGFVELIGIFSQLGVSGLTTLQWWQALVDMFGSDVGNQLHEISMSLYDLHVRLMSFVNTTLIPFVQEHAQTFINILVKVGAILGAGAIVGGILSIGASLLALFNPVTLAIAAVIALVTAYETNFLGMRDAVDGFVKWFKDDAMPAIKKFIQNDFLPAFNDFRDDMKLAWSVIKPELEKLRVWFVETALPAIRDFILNDAIPAIESIAATIQDIWAWAQPYLAKFFDWFVETALPAIRDFILNDAIPAIETIASTLVDVWNTIQPYLEKFYNWFTQDALPAVNRFINDTLIPTINTLVSTLKKVWDEVQPKLQSFYNYVMTSIGSLKTSIFDPLANAINSVINTITNLVNKIATLDLGVLDQISGLVGRIPGLATGGAFAGLARVGETGEELVYAPGGAVVIPPELTQAIQSLTGNNYNLTVNTSGPTTNIQNDFRMMEALASG